ncbi:hypothetical protein OR16_31629 [Cupriavidus basilensis OR16]|uniref:Mor transcription activator domain-containing protein n=1 Tax=Cupriavidus basilensis OR16 TaxID=1127483 RepID=H1SDM0_9BURK|nr:Mor transcription activator family protein [Cupriavidus basilensis]EHP39405.1 hypothetical protein OR16_31629 [Cupriavidus basilensis OR16]
MLDRAILAKIHVAKKQLAFAKELAELIGLAETIAFVRAFGGLDLWIPKGRRELGSARYEAIAEVVGAEAAEKLIARYGGDRMYVPRCQRSMTEERWSRIIGEFDRGASAPELALKYRLSERAIWKILKKPVSSDNVGPAQQQLF